MALVTSTAYPLAADPSEGWAVVNVRVPHPRTWELIDEELVQAARDHARKWEEFADQLGTLLSAGWNVQGHGSLYATRATGAAELASLLDEVAGRGSVAEWCVADADGGLFSLGGLVAGVPAPPETFPGSPLPALVENVLTGAQRVVDSEADLRSAVAEELLACAQWWRGHRAELSDHAAHDLLDELEQLAVAMDTEPVPAQVSEEASPRSLFEDAPHTRVAVHPVSAVTFTGLMTATGNYSSLTLAPREGLAASMQGRGRALAAELGVAGQHA